MKDMKGKTRASTSLAAVALALALVLALTLTQIAFETVAACSITMEQMASKKGMTSAQLRVVVLCLHLSVA